MVPASIAATVPATRHRHAPIFIHTAILLFSDIACLISCAVFLNQQRWASKGSDIPFQPLQRWQAIGQFRTCLYSYANHSFYERHPQFPILYEKIADPLLQASKPALSLLSESYDGLNIPISSFFVEPSARR